MNKKTFKILVIFILTILLLLINNTISNATDKTFDFSWSGISGQAKNFIDAGQAGSDYINSDNMQSLVGRFGYYFNNYWWRCCTGWIFSNWYTVYDGYTRRGC